jgi:pilus assembly protein CpaD
MNSADPTHGRNPRWHRLVHLVAMTVVAIGLTACKTTGETTASVAEPDDYRQRHPIVIQEKDRTIVLLVGNGRGGLTPAQRADVAAFARQWKRETTGGIAIDLPAHTPNARAAADTLAEIRSVLAAAGVPADGVRVANYQPADPGRLAPIKLTYPRMIAEAGPCGQWPHDMGPSYDPHYTENRQFYNFGCTAQRNLAAIVDNPADLVQPRGETPASTARRTYVLEKYRKGEGTATADDSSDKAKISDVGK